MTNETREPTKAFAGALLKLLFWILVAAALATPIALLLGWT